MRLVLFALAALACACGGAPLRGFPPPSAAAPLRVCVLLPEEQQARAKAAVDSWSECLQGWKRIEAVDVSRGVMPPCDYEVTEVDYDYQGALAWATLGGRTVWMRKGLYERDTKGILLHELGHVLGAQHVPGTLMHSTWTRNRYVCPDATTVAQVAAYQRLPIELLRWCVPASAEGEAAPEEDGELTDHE